MTIDGGVSSQELHEEMLHKSRHINRTEKAVPGRDFQTALDSGLYEEVRLYLEEGASLDNSFDYGGNQTSQVIVCGVHVSSSSGRQLVHLD